MEIFVMNALWNFLWLIGSITGMSKTIVLVFYLFFSLSFINSQLLRIFIITKYPSYRPLRFGLCILKAVYTHESYLAWWVELSHFFRKRFLGISHCRFVLNLGGLRAGFKQPAHYISKIARADSDLFWFFQFRLVATVDVCCVPNVPRSRCQYSSTN